MDFPPYGLRRWSEVSNLPENLVLSLADEGVRHAHYVYAKQYPERYPGHSGGSLTCPHKECVAVREAIIAVII